MNTQPSLPATQIFPMQKSHLSEGLACGVGAGALWGLVFLAPALTHSFHPLVLTIGRYVCYGLLSLCFLIPRWKKLSANLSFRTITRLNVLSILGNTLYYILLSAAVQNGGIAMTSLIIGFLPVAVTIIGSRDRGSVHIKHLVPSIISCVLGVLCIGWQAVMVPSQTSASSQLFGLLCATGALASWTAYAIQNARSLKEYSQISAQDWSLLTGIVTGAQNVLLIPVAMFICREAHTTNEWILFVSTSVAIALLASIAGNALWNRMSQLLPLTLVGQMILFETLFALIYGLAWEHRFPTSWESASFVLVVASVMSCLKAHQNKGTHLDS